MERVYEVGLVGVTGYTGQLAAQFAYKLNETLIKSGDQPIRFAFIGRNQQAIEEIVEKHRSEMSADLMKQWPEGPGILIVRDLEDSESLDKATSQCTVIVSYAGPFTVCGEYVVASCVRSGTGYMDITAELPWVKRMELTYGSEIAEKKLKFIPCCGFDFLPNDLMMMQLAMVCESDKTVIAWGGLNALQEVTNSFSQSTPMVSGGTAVSGIGMAKAIGFGNVLNWYLNPYAICNNSPINSLVDSAAHPSVFFAPRPMSRDANLWSGEYCVKFVMSYLMAKYIHWSNEVQNYKFGRNLRYYGGESRKNIMWAWFWSGIVWLGFCAVSLMSLLPPSAAKYLVPRQGSGPKVDPESAYMYSHLKADFPQGVVDLKWRMVGGESYVFAASATVVAAMVMCRQTDILPEKYGLLPASVALGPQLLSELTHYTTLEVAAPTVTSL